MMIEVPRGLEVLVKKAAVDAAFRECLLRERDAAADRIGLVLEPPEAALLRAIPAAQLEAVVANTTVPPRSCAAFMGYAAAAMLAAMTTSTACKPHSSEVPDADVVSGQHPGSEPTPTNAGGGSRSNDKIGIVGGLRPPVMQINNRFRQGRFTLEIPQDVSMYVNDGSFSRYEPFIRDKIWEDRAAILSTYIENYQLNPGIPNGTINLEFVITPDGRTTNVWVTKNTIGDARLVNDVVKLAETWRFGRVTGGPVTIVCPLTFYKDN